MLGIGACGRPARRAAQPRRQPASSDVEIVRGVHYRRLATPESPIWLVDVDLTQPGIRVGVACRRLKRDESPRYGDALTAGEWCSATGAVAAVNGGYFGDSDGGRKEIVGLLASRGEVLSGARRRRGSRGGYVGSVFGVDPDGAPGIRWAIGSRGRQADLTVFDHPEGRAQATRWRVRDAVGCGPTLVHEGRLRVTDRQERLASRGRLPRTFVCYSVRDGRTDRLVLAVAASMEYSDAARFITGYFPSTHRQRCWAAMCLDGGGSSQLAYVREGRVSTPAPSPVTVPTAVVVWSGADKR